MGRLLAYMTATVEVPELPPTAIIIQAKTVNGAEAPYDLVRTMRASILTLGPLVARNGSARVSLPGGCSIGARPVDLHLKALEQMGAEIGTSHGYVEARVPGGGRLPGGNVVFDKITVTGTENVLMAAALAKGETKIENAAREPEISDLANLLIKMGADIQGAGTPTIRVQGKEKLHGARHTIISDRIEAGLRQPSRGRPQHLDGLHILRSRKVEAGRNAGVARIAPIGVPARLEPDLDPGAKRRALSGRTRSRDQPHGAAGIAVPRRCTVGRNPVGRPRLIRAHRGRAQSGRAHQQHCRD